MRRLRLGRTKTTLDKSMSDSMSDHRHQSSASRTSSNSVASSVPSVMRHNRWKIWIYVDVPINKVNRETCVVRLYWNWINGCIDFERLMVKSISCCCIRLFSPSFFVNFFQCSFGKTKKRFYLLLKKPFIFWLVQTLRKVAFKFLNNLLSKATLKSWILTFFKYYFSVLIPTKAIEATKARRAMPRLSQASPALKDLTREIQGVRRKKHFYLF